MIGNYWYEIDIDTKNAVNFDVRDYCLNNLNLASFYERFKVVNPSDQGNLKDALWVFDDPDFFLNQEWLSNVQESFPEFKPFKFLCFYKGDNSVRPIAHIDKPYNDVDLKEGTNLFETTVGFNWVYEDDPKESEMYWFSPYDRSNERYIPTGRGSGYQCLERKYLTTVDRKTLRDDLITVCRVDEFHEVDTGNKDRWGITIRIPEFWRSWEELYETLDKRGLVKSD